MHILRAFRRAGQMNERKAMFAATTMRINGRDKEVFLVSPIEYLDRNGNAIESMYEYPEEEHYMFCKDLDDGATIFMADIWENACANYRQTIITPIGVLRLCEDDHGNIVIKKHIDQNLVNNKWKPVPIKLRNREPVSREELKQYVSKRTKDAMFRSLKELARFDGKDNDSKRVFGANLKDLLACRYILDGIENNKFSHSQLTQMASRHNPAGALIQDDFDKKISEYFTQSLNRLN